MITAAIVIIIIMQLEKLDHKNIVLNLVCCAMSDDVLD